MARALRDRLSEAGEVAPLIRRAAMRPRRVALVNADGEVTGYTTNVDIARALLAKREIEIDVLPGRREMERMCVNCGQEFPLTKRAPHQRVCPRGCPCAAGCGTRVGHMRVIALRSLGVPANCQECRDRVRVQQAAVVACDACGSLFSRLGKAILCGRCPCVTCGAVLPRSQVATRRYAGRPLECSACLAAHESRSERQRRAAHTGVARRRARMARLSRTRVTG